MRIADWGLRGFLNEALERKKSEKRNSENQNEVGREGLNRRIFEGGGTGRAECAEGGDEGGVAACADGDPGGGAGGADEGGEPVKGEGAAGGGVGVTGEEGEDAGGGGEVEGAEPEGKEEPAYQKRDGGGEAASIEDQTREGKLESGVGLRLR